MLATTLQSFDNWVFDVSALMVLINEAEELKYRLSGRFIAESLVAAPVAGIQTYLKSYEILLTPSSRIYFSPFGCKSAPLRNMKLDNYISKSGLLEDDRFTLLRLSAADDDNPSTWAAWTWLATTWCCASLIIVLALHTGKMTWIGVADYTVLLFWSLILRLTEFIHVKPKVPYGITQPDIHEAAFILGRGSSAVVIEGSRAHVKRWTSGGLVYNQSHPLCFRQVCQAFTRVGTLLVLLFIFATIPNGSTVDQLAFILLNILGQINTAIGLRINAGTCKSSIQTEPAPSSRSKSRTHIYAEILKAFKDIPDKRWIEMSNLLPSTEAWSVWAAKILDGDTSDPKDLYKSIVKELEATRTLS